MSRLPRRLISISVVVVLLPLLIVLGPLLVVGAAVIDLLTGKLRFPTVRLGFFAVVYLIHDWIGLLAAAWLWMTGRSGDYTANRRLQTWFLDSLLRWAGRILGVRVQLPDPSTLPTGDTVVLSRHSSMVDAVLPAVLYLSLLDRPVHYVLKRELLWDPAFDIVGERLNNHFVARGGDTAQEVAAIAAMAAEAQPEAALVIFPEGTYGTDANRARVRASLASRGETDLVQLADELEHLLPPKAAGALALLDARPDASVVILGHTGLEGLAHLSGLRSNLPARAPIVIEWWTIQPDAIPDDEPGRIRWLHNEWRRLDQWVGRANALREDEA